jgi:starch synthase
MKHILMIAAENGAIPGGKVGGIGDVVRDVPRALTKRNCSVSVITPAYGVFTNLPDVKRIKSLKVPFAGVLQTIDIFQLPENSDETEVHHFVIDHALFSNCGIGEIYCDDPPDRPFATDASKFALFCSAVAEAIVDGVFGKPDVLHLHDWHAAILLVLRHYMPGYKSLQSIQCAYTIHNLALQGIRPFRGDKSSLEEWFPDLVYDPVTLGDPRWADCINPMASAIRLADTVHAVSPNYAQEVLQPSDSSQGQYGGEGLEIDLQQASRENRLFGILNGCEYPKKKTDVSEPDDWPQLIQQMQQAVLVWASQTKNLASHHFIAMNALNQLIDQRPTLLLTSVGRITDQKVALMRQQTTSGVPALHAALDTLSDYGMLLVVGSGDSDCEQFLSKTAARYRNFIFLRGYSDDLANAFFQQGDLFFMPSSFEPCGISQMLALREGQPCLVHEVGGLKDTIIDNKTGFIFSGSSLAEQADALVVALQRARTLHQKKPAQWQKMCKAASKARFEWTDSVDAYITHLYNIS